MSNPLKLRTPFMEGPTVKRLQEFGDMLGYDTGDNDGVFGPQTEKTVRKIQHKLGLAVDGICGTVTWTAIEKALSNNYVEACDDDGCIVDIRGSHTHPKLYKCKREVSTVTGVTLHQTGCMMPKDPYKWHKLNAHIGLTNAGVVVLVNDPSDWIWHAQGLSKTTIGIEVCGNFEGVVDNPKTLWAGGGGPHTLNDAMVAGADAMFDWLVDWFAENELQWHHVYAHRQSAPSRIADPGEKIWKSIALQWMERLSIDPAVTRNEVFGKKEKRGRPIPKEWDSASNKGY